MTVFRKRIYRPKLFFGDLGFLGRNFFKIISAYRSGLIPWSMAEKIMLSATAVNECTHCTRFHTTLAVLSGVDHEEVNELLSMDIDRPSEFYGEDKTRDIMLYIRIIMLGNLGGNTFDAFFSRLKGRPANNSGFVFELFVMLFALPMIIGVWAFSKLKSRKVRNLGKESSSPVRGVTE